MSDEITKTEVDGGAVDPVETPPGVGADGGGADNSGKDKKYNELLTEVKAERRKRQALEKEKQDRETEEAKRKGEYDKVLAEREKKLDEREKQLKLKSIENALLKANATDPEEYAHFISSKVESDMSNIDDVVKGLQESKPHWFQAVGVQNQQFNGKGKPSKPFQEKSGADILNMSDEAYAGYREELMRRG